MKILYPVIDGEITGGNIICLRIIEEALKRGYGAVVNSPAEGKFTFNLRQKGVKVYDIDTRRTFRLDSAIKLARIIKKENIGLIHSHVPLAGTVLSRIAGLLAGIPVINHAHLCDNFNRYIFLKNLQFFLNWMTSRLFCAKVIAVSEGVKKQIVGQGVAPDKVAVVYNGFDIIDEKDLTEDYTRLRSQLGIRAGYKIVGEVGRLCESKGQEILIKAAKEVIREFPETVFIFVGEDLVSAGRYKEKLESLAYELGLDTRVIFTGYRSDILELMSLFDIFVLPSTVEGFSLVILEAMAAKKPVIATPAGGNAELVIQEETGTIVPMQDSSALADAIIYHLKNPGISAAMGEKGYERLRENFSSREMLNKIMCIYDEILRRA